MERNYTLIGLYSFVLSFALSFPVSGLLWLIFYNNKKFAADFALFKVYSFQSMIMLTFALIFIFSAAYFYFLGLPSLTSLFKKGKAVVTKTALPKQTPASTQPTPSQPTNEPPTLGA